MTRQFHLLDLRNQDFPYTKGWMDVSEKILLANFNLLKEFVEKEEPFRFHFQKNGRKPNRNKCYDQGEYDALEHARHVGREIWQLYVWWTQTRGPEHAAFQKLLMTIYHGSKKSQAQLSPLMNKHPKWRLYLRTEDRLQKTDQNNLHRLIEIRESLWT